jgi:hypothetical protein
MPKRIKPDVNEISLAFNPANMKKFLMHKDDDKKNLLKGEESMEEFVKMLKDQGLLPDEASVLVFTAKLKENKIENLDSVENLTKALGFAFELIPTEDSVKDKIRKDLESEIKKTLEPELRKALEPEIKKALEKEMNKSKDDSVKLLKDQVETLTKDLGEARKEVEVERDARRLSEIKTEVAEMGLPGDLEKISKTVLMTEKTNPELAKDVVETLKTTGAAFKASGAFSEIGSSQGGKELGDAYGKLMDMKNALMKDNPKMPEHKAWAQICRENVELYKAYTKEHHAKGGMH